MLFKPENNLDFSEQDAIYLNKGEKPMLVEMGQLFKAEGKAEGIIEDKQNILILQCERKIGLSEQETKFIRTVTDLKKLDKALEEILFTNKKEEILKILK